MSKIGRNSLCPCGSGLKYKKCCLSKNETEVIAKVSQAKHFMSYDEVNEMSTPEIINKLESMGIPFDKAQFLKDVEKYNSAEQLSKNWYSTYNVTAVNHDRDFPRLSVRILWERLAPKHILSIEHIDNLIQMGYERIYNRNLTKACDVWLEAWNGIKYHIKQEDRRIDSLEQLFPDDFYTFSDVLADLEMELQNAGIDNPVYYDKCILYCREVCNYFSDEEEEFLHGFRRAIAECLFKTDHIEEAVVEFNRLIADYPDNIWSYIAYGDIYWLLENEKTKDRIKAKEFYEKALLIAKDKEDIDTIMERIDDLED